MWSSRVLLGIRWHTQIGWFDWEFIRDCLQRCGQGLGKAIRDGAVLRVGMVIVTSFYSPIPEGGERGQETAGKLRTSEGGRVWRRLPSRSPAGAGLSEEGCRDLWGGSRGINTLTLFACSLVFCHRLIGQTRKVRGLEATLCHPFRLGHGGQNRVQKLRQWIWRGKWKIASTGTLSIHSK